MVKTTKETADEAKKCAKSNTDLESKIKTQEATIQTLEATIQKQDTEIEELKQIDDLDAYVQRFPAAWDNFEQWAAESPDIVLDADMTLDLPTEFLMPSWLEPFAYSAPAGSKCKKVTTLLKDSVWHQCVGNEREKLEIEQDGDN